MRRRQAVPSGPGPAQGFSLLEMLLSLSLTVILLSALYAALDLHWKFSNAGQVEAERAQIARAILNRLAADIRSVTFEDSSSTTSSTTTGTDSSETDTSGTGTADSSADMSSTAGSDTSSTSSSAAATDSGFEDPADAWAALVTGVYGHNSTLVLHVSNPDRSQRLSAAGSGLKAVAWMTGEGTGTLEQLAVMQLLAGGRSQSTQYGVVRMSVDRLTLAGAQGSPDMAALSASVEQLASEISSITFEYHDGLEWASSWDSQYMERLPNAIGITLTFRDPEFPEGSILRTQISDTSRTFRLVVPIAAANPFQSVEY